MTGSYWLLPGSLRVIKTVLCAPTASQKAPGSSQRGQEEGRIESLVSSTKLHLYPVVLAQAQPCLLALFLLLYGGIWNLPWTGIVSHSK